MEKAALFEANQHDATQAFRILKDHFAKLSSVHQRALRSYLTGPHVEPSHLEDACRALLAMDTDPNPETIASNTLANGKDPLIGKFTVPLLLWSTTQIWADRVEVVYTRAAWQSIVCQVQHPSVRHRAVMSLIDSAIHLPGHVGIAMNSSEAKDLVAYAFAALDWKMFTQGANAAGMFAIELGGLVQEYHRLQGKSNTKLALAPLWEKEVKRACDDLMDERWFLTVLLHSPLHEQLRLAVANICSHDMWLDPDISPLIAPLLPPNEAERYKQLPWRNSTAHDLAGLRAIAARDNEATMALYCPHMHQTLSLVAQPSDWTNRRQMLKLQALLNRTAEESLPLPDSMDLSV